MLIGNIYHEVNRYRHCTIPHHGIQIVLGKLVHVQVRWEFHLKFGGFLSSAIGRVEMNLLMSLTIIMLRRYKWFGTDHILVMQ